MELSTRNAIIGAVTDFVKGGDERNLQLLEHVLHTDFRNLQSGFFEKKGVFNIDKTAYLSLIERHRFGGVEREMHVISVDSTGNIALVKVQLNRPEIRFVSFITLVRDEHQTWKVVGNYPHIEPINN